MTHHLPQPLVQAFLTCREIIENMRTGEFVLIGPFTYVPATDFPVNLRASIYIQFKGGHGTYALDFHLRDLEANVLWQSPPVEVDHSDPLFPYRIAIHDMLIAIPKAGKYDLVLSANGEELSYQTLWIGPAELFAGESETLVD